MNKVLAHVIIVGMYLKNNQSKIHILFFDGVCLFCNRIVLWLLKFDKAERLSFATLQGKRAQNYLSTAELKSLDTVIFYDGNKKYYKSEAFFKILSLLPWYFYPMYILKIFPSSFLDIIYDLIAQNRHKIFGKSEVCFIPSKKNAHRFLD